ncbi:MAG: VOC family protein [bacterium]
MPTTAYLHFQGQCAAALTYYAKVFGGTDLQTMRYSDGPEVPPDWQDSPRIMHGQVTLGDGVLMASDYPPGVDGSPQSGFSVMHTATDVPKARAMFDQLVDGGVVINPFAPTFFSPGFGMVRDKFGTSWIISTLPAAAAAS